MPSAERCSFSLGLVDGELEALEPRLPDPAFIQWPAGVEEITIQISIGILLLSPPQKLSIA